MTEGQKRKADDDVVEAGTSSKQLKDGTGNDLCPEAWTIIEERVKTGQFSMDLLDDKVIESLKAFNPTDQANVLRQFFRTEISSMKNPSAYLSGILRSSRTSKMASIPQSFMNNSLVGQQLKFMYRQGCLKPGDLDEKLMQRIMTEPEELVLAALSLFAENVPSDCRNRSAFFTAQLKNAHRRLSSMGPPGMRHPGGPMPRGPPMIPNMGMPGGPRGPPMAGNMGQVPGMQFNPGMAGPPSRGPSAPGMMHPQPGMDESALAHAVEFEGAVRDFSQEQLREGVRIDELHNCSEFSRFVAPFVAKELQNQFDCGLSLVDQMDNAAWRQLAALGPGDALDIVQEVGEAMRAKKIRNPNAFFTSIVKKRCSNIMERAAQFEDAVRSGKIVRAGGDMHGPVGGPMQHGLGIPGGPRGMPGGPPGPRPETHTAYEAPMPRPGDMQSPVGSNVLQRPNMMPGRNDMNPPSMHGHVGGMEAMHSQPIQHLPAHQQIVHGQSGIPQQMRPIPSQGSAAGYVPGETASGMNPNGVQNIYGGGHQNMLQNSGSPYIVHNSAMQGHGTPRQHVDQRMVANMTLNHMGAGEESRQIGGQGVNAGNAAMAARQIPAVGMGNPATQMPYVPQHAQGGYGGPAMHGMGGAGVGGVQAGYV